MFAEKALEILNNIKFDPVESRERRRRRWGEPTRNASVKRMKASPLRRKRRRQLQKQQQLRKQIQEREVTKRTS